MCVLGEASEEEEEIRGCTDGGECRPVGDGHGSRHGAHLQYHEGGTALYAGEFDFPQTETGTCASLVFLILKCHPILQNQMETLSCNLCMLGRTELGGSIIPLLQKHSNLICNIVFSFRMEATAEG